MARRDVLRRILEHLDQCDTPKFTLTQIGELLTYPEGSVAAAWYVGDEPYSGGGVEGKTLGNVMISERIRVRCYWPPAVDASDSFEVEAELWDASRALQEAFRGDSQLDNSDIVNDLDVQAVDVGWIQMPDGTVLRVLSIDLLLHNLNAESISA